ncbi:hypothetical protein PsorP6_012706 [Peronosclerospora sorghi]|uniref:Uncharacterized protein n=1 Tax=Peronosclerospora sorghi TaxID=230839 RepID=A0ACC0WJG6_9STRA|nr:hypothetical protein PsorP6_012706 [Peronosclerospora sorghi]
MDESKTSEWPKRGLLFYQSSVRGVILSKPIMRVRIVFPLTGHAHMNQEDFRRLVSSREAPRDGQRYGGKRNLTETDLAAVKQLVVKKNKTKRQKPPKTTSASEVDGPVPTLYRDRAAERRRGDAGNQDTESAHAVKGLDYALLARLKQEKAKLVAEKQQLVEQAREARQEDGSGKLRDDRVTFKTRMGRVVYFHACQSTRATRTGAESDLFLPGRMHYTFNLSSLDMESIPVSVQTSKEECPEPAEVLSGRIDESLLDRVAQVMRRKKHGKKRQKDQDQETCDDRGGETEAKELGVDPEAGTEAHEAPAAGIEDDDDAIFPDVGEYIPVDQRLEADSTNACLKEGYVDPSSYFSNLSASITEKEAATRKQEQDAEAAWKATVSKARDAQAKLELEQARRAKQAKMRGDVEAYAEYQNSGTFSDSDEDDETTRRRKAAGGKKHAEGEDGTEKVRRKKQKEQSKLANDLEKINKVRRSFSLGTAYLIPVSYF